LNTEEKRIPENMYVELKNINKNYENCKASDNVSFGIEKGKLIGLLGSSGSGKTTILRMIAGLESPDSGEIIIDGKVVNDIPGSKRGIGFVFQNYALFRYMTVYDNIAFGLKVQKADKAFIAERVNKLISLVGLSGLEKRYPGQLSGGQRQRVAFARALAPNPQLLLLDEPFAAIDAKVRQELRSWLKEMIEKLGVTSIFVTHDQDEAIEVADEIIIVNKGRIEQMGTPFSVYQNPKTAFTATFFGQPSFLTDYTRFHSFDEKENIDKAFVRPEFVKVTKKNEEQKFRSSASEGVVERVSFRGGSTELLVRVNDSLITARREPDDAEIRVGERVDVFLYRLFVTVGDDAFLLENRSLQEDYFVI
jgi:sulfate transport system ATP-binding protein